MHAPHFCHADLPWKDEELFFATAINSGLRLEKNRCRYILTSLGLPMAANHEAQSLIGAWPLTICRHQEKGSIDKSSGVGKVSCFREKKREMKYSATAYVGPKCVFSVVERLTVNTYYCCHCKQKTHKTHWADDTIFIIKVYIERSSMLRQSLSL